MLIQFQVSFNSFNIKVVFLYTASLYKGSRGMCWHVYSQALFKTTGPDVDCSLEDAFDRQIRRQVRVFEHYFCSWGREFERSSLQKFKCPGFFRVRDVEVSS